LAALAVFAALPLAQAHELAAQVGRSGGYPATLDIASEEAGMDTEHRFIAKLLVLKDAPDHVIVAHVQAIGVIAARSILYDEAIRLKHTDQHAAMDCIALMSRINALIPRRVQN
jgi:hypothetical protein